MIKLYLFMFFLSMVFGALWTGVLLHLSGWGLVLGIIALVDRVFRVIKMHYKRNGRTWIDL